MKMRKVLLVFASIFFFFTLQSCYTSPLIEQTIQDVTYVMEEQIHHPNSRYLPLLDALERFEDFKIKLHEEDKKYRGDVDTKAKWLKSMYEEQDENDIELLKNFKKHVMGLLNGQETINDYLHYILRQREFLLLARMQGQASFLLSTQRKDVRISFPLSKKLFDFFIEDPLFQEKRSTLKGMSLNSVNSDELMNQLIQIPLALTEANELNVVPERLLISYQPSGRGGPYALLEDIIFADDLIGEKKEACLALRDLLEFDKLRKLYPSNFSFMRALFRSICNHTIPAINLHFLQAIKDHNIKLFYGRDEPESLLFLDDSTINDLMKGPKIIVPESINPAIKKLLAKQEKTPLTSDDWLAYIEGDSNKKKQTYSSSKQYKNKRDNLSANRGKKPMRSPGAKGIKVDKSPKIDPKREKKGPTNLPKQEKKENITTKQLEKPTVNDYPDQSDLIVKKSEPITAAEGEKNVTPRTSVDITVGLNVATIGDGDKAASVPPNKTIEVTVSPIKTEDNDTKLMPVPADQTLVVNTSPIKTETKEITTLPSSGDIHIGVHTEASKIAPSNESSFVKEKKHTIITPSFIEKNFTPEHQLAGNKLSSGKASKKSADTISPTKRSKQDKKREIVPSPIIASTSGPDHSPGKEKARNVSNDLSKKFIMPRGLRSFHIQMISKAYPIIATPIHQNIIDQLFDHKQQCNTSYHEFKTLWTANGGFILGNSGSHRTLQFPLDVNLFGIYKPHGSSASSYGKQAVRYLQAAILYIGLRPTDW